MTMQSNTGPAGVTPQDVPVEPTRLSRVVHDVLRHPGLLIGSGVLVLFVLMAVFAPLIAPYDPYAQDLTKRLIDPVWHASGSWTHPLGTDHLGRDYLSRMIYGVRISLIIGAATAVISGVIGTILGLVAGYFGGKVDSVVMFLITNRLSMPVILIALSAVALVKGSLTVVILILGFLLWDRFAVVVRSATMQVRSLDYVTAAECLGCSRAYVIAREILPNILPQVIVVATLEMAHAILLEAALSFLGLGVQPPTPSWGLMVAEGRAEMLFSPWITAIPGFGLLALVLAINLVGDGVRDVLAPERRT